jgi:sarcinarray family protein
LKIGEPFDIGVNIAVYQKCYVAVMLTEIGDNDFEIVNGSTSKMKDYGEAILDKNSSKMFNWTVKPTDNWAGGSLPINLVHRFQITCIFLYHNSAGDLIYFFNFILPLKYHRFFIE